MWWVSCRTNNCHDAIRGSQERILELNIEGGENAQDQNMRRRKKGGEGGTTDQMHKIYETPVS